ncbi:ABC transporter substrate-binding protein [Thorsellia kenyensis]|uniref:ABC transporter substrate-binding protein n=1 Tax=Thorsellia kenyensis TaxID=1549888 RepID=A0ABV6CB94_9GAMM
MQKKRVYSLLFSLIFTMSVSANTTANTNTNHLTSAEITTVINPDAIKLIPQNYTFVNEGKLTIAIPGLNAPPLYMFAEDNKTLLGSEIDLAKLIAASLGKELEVVVTSWEDWPLGIQSGKYDAAIANITVTKERKEKFDFATYRQDTLGFYVKNESSITAIQEAKDIAGLKIIVGAGTNQEAILLAWDKENQQKGLEPFVPFYSRDDAAMTLALLSGRADAYFGPYVTGAYKAKQTGKTRLVGQIEGGWPKTANIAITLKKGTKLVNAIQASINGLISDGTYHQVLAKWNESLEAITYSEINPPGLGD